MVIIPNYGMMTMNNYYFYCWMIDSDEYIEIRGLTKEQAKSKYYNAKKKLGIMVNECGWDIEV